MAYILFEDNFSNKNKVHVNSGIVESWALCVVPIFVVLQVTEDEAQQACHTIASAVFISNILAGTYRKSRSPFCDADMVNLARSFFKKSFVLILALNEYFYSKHT